MDSRVEELVRAQSGRAAADEMRMQLGLEVQKQRDESKAKNFSVKELNEYIARLSDENDGLRSKLRRSEARKTELEDEVEQLEVKLRSSKRAELLAKAGYEDDGDSDGDRPPRNSDRSRKSDCSSDDVPKKLIGRREADAGALKNLKHKRPSKR